MEERIISLEQKTVSFEERMNRLEERMDRLEERMARMEERMDRMEARMDRMEAALLANIEETRTLRETLATALVKIDGNFNAIVKELVRINERVEQIDRKVDSLRGDTSIGLEDLGVKIENLTGEISKIGAVMNYKEYYENLRGLN